MSHTATHERERIRAHLLHAEVAARTTVTSTLDRPRQLARELLLRELTAYRERGEFPENTDVPGARHPTFVDHRGVRCAMAHLLEHGGATALVERVARERNLAYVEELADVDGLVAWLSAAGLTVEEAARIQPGYTFSTAACVCGGGNDFAMPGGIATTPPDRVDAVLEVTYLAPAPQRAGAWRVRIEAIHGSLPDATVGNEILVDASSVVGLQGTLAAGALALLDLGPGRELVAAETDAGLPDDTVLPYTLLTLTPTDQSVHCLEMSRVGIDVPTTTRTQLVDARSHGDTCADTLVALDARWGTTHSWDGMGSSSGGSSSGSISIDAGASSSSGGSSSGTAAPDDFTPDMGGGCDVTTGASAASLPVLFAVVGSLVARRRARLGR